MVYPAASLALETIPRAKNLSVDKLMLRKNQYGKDSLFRNRTDHGWRRDWGLGRR